MSLSAATPASPSIICGKSGGPGCGAPIQPSKRPLPRATLEQTRFPQTMDAAFFRPPHLPEVRHCRTLTVRIFTTRTYERAIRKLLSEPERCAMEAAIVANPGDAPVIRGTGGLRKLRWARLGRGKRVGIRTIYYRHGGRDTIYLLTAYAKAEREDLSSADRKVLSRLVVAIKKEERNR